MKKMMIIIAMTLLLFGLFGCRSDGQDQGSKAVVWNVSEEGHVVMLLVEGNKATSLQTFDGTLKDSPKVGDVYEGFSGSGEGSEELTLFTNAGEDIYLMDINDGESLKKDYPDIYLVDVRSEEEYRQGHLEGSVLLPVDQLKEGASTHLPNKETPVLVYCRSGNRSAQAANLLKELGYALVIDLGGITTYQGTLSQ